MKRLLYVSLALALVYSISFPARAELLKNIKTDGSIEIRSFGIDNGLDLKSVADDYRNDTRTRLMVGASSDLLDDVHARVQLLKNTRRYGDNGTGSGEEINSMDVFVPNAYVKVDKVFDHVDLTMGRQYYGRSDDLVIYYGPNNDADLTVNSLDMFRADADVNGYAKIQAMAGKLQRAPALAATSNSDTDVFGAEVNSDKVIPKGNLALYYYTRQIKKGAGLVAQVGNDTLNVYGFRAAGDILMGLGYQVEGVMNGGRDQISATSQPGYNGTAYLLALKWADEIMLPLRASAEYGVGSRTFQAISAGKRLGVIWGRFSGTGYPSGLVRSQATGLENLRVADVSVGANPLKKLGVDVAWYRFTAVDGGVNGTNTNGRKSLGTEYDLVLSWKHSDNVSFEVNAASLQIGDALRPAGSNSPVTEIGGDVKIKF
jgi:hypothetical protein